MTGNFFDEEEDIDGNSIAGMFARASRKEDDLESRPSNSKYFNFDQLVEITFSQPRDFLRIAETLTRVGIQSETDPNTITQICYILSKKEMTKYYLCHENELRKMDGEPVDVTEGNIARRNLIAKLLVQWNLARVVNPSQIEAPVSSFKGIRVISHKSKEEGNWNLVQNYPIGKRYQD